MNRNNLKMYKHNKEWIHDKLEYIEEQKATLYKITQTINDMPVGIKKVQDSMAEKLAGLMDNLNTIVAEIDKMQQELIDIELHLMKIDQPYRNILDKVYIQGKTLVQVANDMNYSYEHTKHMHGIALNEYDKGTY